MRFRIRTAHTDALRRDQERRLRPIQICDILHEDFSEFVADLDDSTLRERVDVAIERASSYGIAATENIISFFVLMCRLGPRFDQHPAVHVLLTSESFREDEINEHLQRGLEAIDIIHIISSGARDPWS